MSDKDFKGFLGGGKSTKPVDREPVDSKLVRPQGAGAVEKPSPKTSALAGKYAGIAQGVSHEDRQAHVATYTARKGRFLIALDGTGSMQHLINGARDNITEIIRRLCEAAKADRVEIRIVVFRDYCDQNERGLMAVSDLSDAPDYFSGWLANIVADGGGDMREAVEAVLQYGLEEGSFDAILLAGDAPSHTKKELEEQAPQGALTAKELATKFGEVGVPIHTFVAGQHSETVQDFTAIAQNSGGQTGFLSGGDDMLNMAVMAMLERMKGAAAVRAYLALHNPTGNALAFGRLLLMEGKKPGGPK